MSLEGEKPSQSNPELVTDEVFTSETSIGEFIQGSSVFLDMVKAQLKCESIEQDFDKKKKKVASLFRQLNKQKKELLLLENIYGDEGRVIIQEISEKRQAIDAFSPALRAAAYIDVLEGVYEEKEEDPNVLQDSEFAQTYFGEEVLADLLLIREKYMDQQFKEFQERIDAIVNRVTLEGIAQAETKIDKILKEADVLQGYYDAVNQEYASIPAWQAMMQQKPSYEGGGTWGAVLAGKRDLLIPSLELKRDELQKAEEEKKAEEARQAELAKKAQDKKNISALFGYFIKGGTSPEGFFTVDQVQAALEKAVLGLKGINDPQQLQLQLGYIYAWYDANLNSFVDSGNKKTGLNDYFTTHIANPLAALRKFMESDIQADNLSAAAEKFKGFPYPKAFEQVFLEKYLLLLGNIQIENDVKSIKKAANELKDLLKSSSLVTEGKKSFKQKVEQLAKVFEEYGKRLAQSGDIPDQIEVCNLSKAMEGLLAEGEIEAMRKRITVLFKSQYNSSFSRLLAPPLPPRLPRFSDESIPERPRQGNPLYRKISPISLLKRTETQEYSALKK